MPDTLTFQLDDLTLNALDELAEKTERSRASLISQAVQDYVALTAWQLRKTEAGVAAAERGDFAPDGDVTRVRAKFSPQG